MDNARPSAGIAKNSRRGSKPGERRGGRQKGTPNKRTKDIREYAQQFTQEAIDVFRRVMRNGDSDAAKVAAADKLLNRGHGLPRQVQDLNVNVSFGEALERAQRRLEGRNAA